MKWYHMRGPEGTITCKGRYAAEALHEAAERWGCDAVEISVTGDAPYFESDWTPGDREDGFFACGSE